VSLRHRFEADMFPAVAAAARELIGPRRDTHGVRVFAEVCVASGVADLVAGRFCQEALQTRARSGHGPLLDPAAVQTVHQLAAGAATAQDLAPALTVGLEHLRRRVLPDLRARGWVERHSSDVWELAVPAPPLLEWAVAVEVKRRDWRTGAHQARRYRRFANRSFLAVEAAHAAVPLRYGKDLTATGVGLLTVDAGELAARCHRRARWSRPQRGWEQRLAGERLWQMVLEDRPVGDSGHVFGQTLPRPALIS
jgi:hypothetical protein